MASPKKRKTAKEKLEAIPEAHVVDIPEKMQKRYGAGKMLIPHPTEMAKYIKTIPKGNLLMVEQLRDKMALDHQAVVTCPLCTGIFLNLLAEATEENLSSGEDEIIPYWRVIKDKGKTNEKFPGGAGVHAERLASEGHEIIPAKGKQPPKVNKYEACCIKLY